MGARAQYIGAKVQGYKTWAQGTKGARQGC